MVEQEACVIEATSLQAYFHDSLSDVFKQHDTQLTQEAHAYIVNLLFHFSRSEQVFDWHEKRLTLKPLALLYGEAVHAKSNGERLLLLRRLGDVALFVAGIFGPSLDRKAVGIDYYIDMGGGAYDWLSDNLENGGKHSMSWETFRELAVKFEKLVSALDSFAQNSCLRGDSGLIRLYEKWLRSKDPKCAEQLRKQGVPVSSVDSKLTH